MVTGDIKANTAKERDELAAQIESLQKDFQKLSQTMAKLAGKGVETAREDAMHKAEQVEDIVKTNPFTAVAIATGLGFLFGMMTRR